MHRMLLCGGLTALLAVCAAASPQSGEQRMKSTDELQDLATHVVVGKVTRMSVRRSLSPPWEVRSYEARVEIDEIEKAPIDFDADDLDVRHWDRTWHGTGDIPPASTGHFPLPSIGDEVRVYCTNVGDNGFGTTTDDRFDVLGRNGWEILEKGSRSDEPFGGAELVSDWRETAKLVGVGAVVLLLFFWLRHRRARRVMA